MRKCPSSRSGSAPLAQGKRRSRRRTDARAAWAIGDPSEPAARLRIAPGWGVLGSGVFFVPWLGCSHVSARRIEARLKGAVASAQRAARAFPLRLGSDWLSYGIGRAAGRRETRARRSQPALIRLEFMGRGGHGAGRIRQFGEPGPTRQIRRGGLRVSGLSASTSDSRKTRAPTRRSRRRKIRKK